MHSSRMRTARALTVSPSILCFPGGVPGPGGTWSGEGVCVPGPGGCTWSLGRGCTWSGGVYLVVWGVYLVLGVYLVRGVYLVWEGVPGLGGGVPGLGGVPGPGGCT